MGSLGCPPGVQAQVFHPDDPVQVDPDRRALSTAPEAWPLSNYYDYFKNATAEPGRKGGAAMNINTLGEVPRSSWYTPRHFYDPMTEAELRRGPNRDNAPDTSAVWRVVDGKTEGKSSGFQIVDEDGDRYLLKFDNKDHVELSSGAEVVVTHFLYALGYHVPQNYPVRFHRDRLEPKPGATYVSASGEERRITQRVISRFLRDRHRYKDGTYRAVASLFLDGRPLGPFQYAGTRPDDPNDIFPHEMRRELRGLRLFSAWLNHDDSRGANSLNMLVEEDGAQYVRHYLLDFGTTLGGGPGGPKRLWYGHEHILEPDRILLSSTTLGFGGRPWRKYDAPDIPAVGTINAKYFNPKEWRPQYYNPAFRNMTADDAFWAAKQIAHFTRSEIRTIVETGDYSHQATVDFLTRVLVERRDKIARAYLKHGGGLGRFAVEQGRLTFENFLDHPAFEKRTYTRTHVTWHRFDNQQGRRTGMLDSTSTMSRRVSLPETTDPYIVAVLRRPEVGPGTTEVFLRRTDEGREVVGIRRTAEGLPETTPQWTVIPEDLRSASRPATASP